MKIGKIEKGVELEDQDILDIRSVLKRSLDLGDSFKVYPDGYGLPNLVAKIHRAARAENIKVRTKKRDGYVRVWYYGKISGLKSTKNIVKLDPTIPKTVIVERIESLSSMIELKYKSREKREVIIRQILYYIMRQYGFTYKQIGSVFGKNHASIINSLRRISHTTTTDIFISEYRKIADELGLVK